MHLHMHTRDTSTDSYLQVVESWDAAEDSEVEREKEAKAAAAKAKADAEALAAKKSKAQRIKEKEAERRRRQQEEEEEDTSSEDEDEEDKRARLRRTEQESDLKHAEDLIGDIDLNKKRAAAPRTVVLQNAADPTSEAVDLATLPVFKPATKDQFAKLTETLIPVLTAHSKKPQYSLWAVDFCKKLVKDMPSQDIKKVASALTTTSNEKLKEEKADRGGKKSKAAKTKTSLVARPVSHMDTTAYDDDLGDDDFM